MADYTKQNTNVSPYHDDFGAHRNLLRILFRPGRAVQGRELTQIQTLLQNQIESFANHIFKDGSPVIGANIKLTKNAPFIEIPLAEVVPTMTSGEVQGLVGQTIQAWTSDVNAPSGTMAEIIRVDNNAGILRIQLIYRGGIFAPGDKWVAIDYENCPKPNPGVNPGFYAASDPPNHITAVGEGIRCTLEPGIVWANGLFISVPEAQEIFVSRNGASGTYLIGYEFEEITLQSGNTAEYDPLDDVTLLGATTKEPASGSNFGADGADRYLVKLNLVAYNITDPVHIIDLDDVDLLTVLPANFFRIIKMTNGVVEERLEKPAYADILDLLADRTYDESGSYTVVPYSCVTKKADAGNFSYEVGPGKSYVFGYEQESIVPTKVTATRARTIRTRSGVPEVANFGVWIDRKVINAVRTFTCDGTNTSTTLDTVTVQGHSYVLGDKATYSNGGGTTPTSTSTLLVSGTAYFIIPVTKDKIAFATTKANATAGTKIDLTGNGAGAAHTLTMLNTDTMNKGFDPTVQQLVYLMSGSGGTGRAVGTARVYFADDQNQTLRYYLGSNTKLLTDLQGAKSICSVNTGNPTGGTTDSWMDISFNNTQAIGFNQPIVELQGKVVKQVTNMSYQTLIKIGGKSVTSGVSYNLVAGGTDEFTQHADPELSVVQIVNASTGAIVDKYSVAVFGTGYSGGGTDTITSGTNHGLATGTYDFYMLVDRFIQTPRSKTLTAATFFDIIPSTGAPTKITFNGSTSQTGGNLSVAAPAHFDFAIIESIIRDPGGAAENVTANYTMDNGQRDLYYDYSSLSGTFTVGQTYRVLFHYWSWGGTGDYFAANSYSAGSDTYFNDKGGYEGRIPTYTNENATKKFILRDCLDFRKNITELSTTAREIVQPLSTPTITYEYYLPRIDKIWIDKEGRFGVTEGLAEEEPTAPPDKSGTVTLFQGFVGGWVYDPFDGSDDLIKSDQISIDVINKKTYTMDDIRRLETRIRNVEAYSAEMQVELESYADTVLDKDGLPRAKSGIFVDKFVDHVKGNVYEPSYRCSMDREEGGLHCPFEMNHMAFEYDNIFAGGESQSNVSQIAQAWTNTITMSYTVAAYTTQPLASETMNINPFNVIVWAGEIELNPWSDTWIETKYLPALQISDPIEAAKIIALYERANAGVPIWNAWTTQIIGRPTTKTVNQWHKDPITGRVTTLADITTTQTQSTRSGSVLEQTGKQTITKDFGERTVDISQIPFMRSIPIAFAASGLKPSTLMTTYFADVNVNAHVNWDGGSGGVTDVSGLVSGTFTVPVKKFQTGKNVLSLKDTIDNPKSVASVEFNANGTLFTKQKNILSVEVPVYSTRAIEESKTSFSTTTRWYDPIAQTFLIEDVGGVFLQSVDIYFASKDRFTPVTLMIVETIAGVPSQNRVPYGTAKLLPYQVTATKLVSSVLKYVGNHYLADNTTLQYAHNATVGGSPTDFVASRFTFSDAVYLKEGVEYAFVLISNSDNYNVYISRMGQLNLWDNKAIDKQPHLGSLLKSQNTSTWTPDQYADIKFKLNRCNFDTSTSTLYMRQKGLYAYWTDILYIVGSKIIYRHTIDGLGIYECIVQTVAASNDNPQDDAAKWKKIGDGFYDATMLNISMDNMVVPGTNLTHQYLSPPDSTWLDFPNKEDIPLLAKDTIEIYNDQASGDLGGTPKGINLKLGMYSTNSWLSPVINKSRTSMIIVNNLVQDPDTDANALDPVPLFDTGEYISETVYLKENAATLKVLVDVARPTPMSRIAVKYRTQLENLRYVRRDATLTATENVWALQDMQDELCYVYYVTTSGAGLTGTVDAIVEKGAVIVDGFDTINSPNRVYLSSVTDPGDFIANSGNTWIMITTEPDIFWTADLNELGVYATNVSTTADRYVIDSLKNLYRANVPTVAPPSPTALDWTLIPTVWVDLAMLEDTDVSWRPMSEVGTVKSTVDTRGFVEYEYAPTVTPSENFDNFAIKIEMYADTEVDVPVVKRLRAIAVN